MPKFTTAAAAIALCALSGCTTMEREEVEMAAPRTEEAQAIAYPTTATVNVVETQFGVPVADPYRWLENDVREDKRVADWVAAQNALTASVLDDIPGRDILKARMTELYDYERIGIPEEAGGRYFYTRNDGLQPQSVLYVRDGLDGEARVLIDPNLWAEDGATALAGWVPSKDGKKIVYAIQDGGSDWRTVKVLDVDSGQVLDDEVRWVKFSGLEWAKDGSGYYYSRFPEPEKGAAFQSLNENHSVYFHRLGTPQSADALVYATPDNPELNLNAQVTDDGKWLLVTKSSGTDARYEVELIDLAGKGAKSRTLIQGFDNDWGYLGNRGDQFVFMTDSDAPLKRIVTLDIAKPGATPQTVVAEDASGKRAKIEGASIVGDKIIANMLLDARSEVRVYDLKGKLERTIALPGIGSASGFGGSPESAETFYSFSSFNRPSTVYRLDVDSGETEIFAAPDIAFDPEDYSVEQKFYRSKDGTEIPMFIIAKKGMAQAGGSPTILYGYGGFDIAITPGFKPERLAWLDQGGVFAVANIRGGSEYGKEWHDGGRLLNKQNVFDDFIAAGRYLIASGVTAKDGLAIEGRSNGGLLVGAVTNQAPELFAATHAAVGVMDMLRFDRFTAGRYWVDDYGYPSKEADFRNLLAYSPYHNIQNGRDYPAVMVSTADTDDRVVPGHSFKYIAALQAAENVGNDPHLIRIETRAGHGAGKPTDKIIDEFGDIYAFLAHHTGLTIR